MKLKTNGFYFDVFFFVFFSFDKCTKLPKQNPSKQTAGLKLKLSCESLILQKLINKPLIFCPLEFRLAVVQLHVSKIKADNLGRAQTLVKEAAGQGAKVVVLPVSITFSVLGYILFTSIVQCLVLCNWFM